MKKLIAAAAILLLASACQSSRSSHTRYLGTAYNERDLWIEVPSSSSRTYSYPSSRTYYSYPSSQVVNRTTIPWSASRDWIDVSPTRSYSYTTRPYTSSRTVTRTTVPWYADTNWVEVPSSIQSTSTSYRASGYNPASWRTTNWVRSSPTYYSTPSTYYSTPSTTVRSTGTSYTAPAKVSSPVYIGPVYGTVNVYP